MSEEETKKNTKEEHEADTEDKKEDLVDINVAILKADLIKVSKERDELQVKLENLMKKYDQAVDLIEKDTKSRLLAEISPRTTVPDSILAMKSVEDLKDMLKVLDTAKVPAFKSGTPIAAVKDSAEHKLNSMFDTYKAQTWGKNK